MAIINQWFFVLEFSNKQTTTPATTTSSSYRCFGWKLNKLRSSSLANVLQKWIEEREREKQIDTNSISGCSKYLHLMTNFWNFSLFFFSNSSSKFKFDEKKSRVFWKFFQCRNFVLFCVFEATKKMNKKKSSQKYNFFFRDKNQCTLLDTLTLLLCNFSMKQTAKTAKRKSEIKNRNFYHQKNYRFYVYFGSFIK